MRLWLETAHQSLARAGEGVCGDAVRTLQTEEQFFAILVSNPQDDEKAKSIADQAASLLEQGTPLKQATEVLLAALPDGEYVPFSILQVLEGYRAYLVECDAPPLFLTRVGRLVLLPVIEEESQGHLVRECDFTVQDGDHMAMVSEGYVRAHPLPLEGGGGERGRILH